MNLNYSFFPMKPSALDAQKKAERQEFWRQQSAKVPASHHLPCYVTARDKVADSAVNTAKYLSATSQLNAEQAAQLQAMSDAQNVSPMAGVLALIHGLLVRYSNETSQSVKLLDAANLDGDASVLVWDEAPLSSLSDAAALVEQQMQAISENLLPNQDYPAAFRDSVNGTKIAVISGSLASKDFAAVQGSGIEGSGIDLAAFVHTVSAESLAEVSNAASLAVTWVANAEVFNANALQLFATHFENLADAALAQPNLNLAQLPLVTNAEEKRWDALNTVTLAYPDNECLASLFESQANKTPNSTAVVTQHTQVNYAQLNGLANQFARFLLTQIDTTAEAPLTIGVCLPRSAAMVAVILAIHKIGAAYVPLDPNYPAERLAYMAENAQISAVICTARNRDIFPQSTAIELALTSENLQQQDLACLTEKVKGFANDNVPRAGELASTERLSHVIYTSGSTGKPKGVAVRHRNTVAMLFWAQSAFSEAELSKVLFSTSLNFDLSVFELFVPLCFGHQCYVVENILDLLHWSPEVTLINTVPSAAQSVLAQQAIPNTVVTVNLAGEPLSAVLVNDLLATTHCSAVCNLYGPSEDTTYSTYARFTSPLEGVPSIGQVLPNSQALILSPAGQQVPDGVEGELYLAGAGVAAGYLHNQALTAERFVANPFYRDDQPCSTAIMYKTGDKVRREADGTLSFLGRFDFQVKVRGFRIELGEIEHQLNQLNHVTDALVSVDGEGSQARLVAYLAFSEKALSESITNEAQWQAQAREQLSQKLPEYMLPDVMLLLAEFPRLPNGKVDRKKLPTADSQLVQAVYRAPRNATEQALCDIWQALLAVERVGIDDNFFQLGGNSLTAVLMGAQCRERLQQQVTLPLLFEHKTIATLAPHLAGVNDNIPASGDTEYPLSFAQERMWFIEQVTAQQSAYHIPCLMHVLPEANFDALLTAITAVISRHPVLTAHYTESADGELRQVYQAPYHSQQRPSQKTSDEQWVNAVIEVADSAALQQQVAQLTAIPFDFYHDASVRVHPLRCGSERYILIVWHHMVFDGWSEGVFFNEVAKVYSNQPVSDSQLRYGDYALWQRQQLQGSVLAEQHTFWKSYLADYQDLALPTDYQRPAQFDYRGDMVTVDIPPALWRQLQQCARQHQTTLYTLLLSGYYLLLSGFSGQRDIVIGTASDNRDDGDVHALIGLFVNSLAIRQRIDANSLVATFIQDVHRNILNAKRFQQLPFDQVVDVVGVERDLSRSPLFQAMFTLQGEHVNAQGLPVAFIPQPQSNIAKFDLNLLIEELASGPVAQFSFARSLFDKTRVQQWASAYVRVLQQLVTCRHVHEVSVLSATEKAQLSTGWYQEKAFEGAHHLAEIFAHSVQHYADAQAVLTAETSITFAELDARSNQVAHYLVSQGLHQNNAFIGVCVTRDINLLVAIVGVIKAGAAFVPLEPKYPSARLQYICEDAALSAVICDQATSGVVQPFAANILEIDACLQHDTHALAVTYHASDVAYVIYTSGSTGQPKGVMVEHRSAANLAHVLADLALGDSSPSTPQKAWGWLGSVAFDGSIKGITQLIKGQPLSIFTEVEKQDIHQVMRRLPELTVIDGTPALIELWLDSALAEALPNIVLGGEAISEGLWQRLVAWQERTGKAVYNMYGPTECTVNTSYIRVAGAYPTIGNSLPNICTFVMDEQQQLLPFDSVGELVIGGAGVARGYIGLPEVTAESFIENKFVEVGHQCTILYRSGDRVKRLANGQLVFVGRNDDQVKISGYRIELGEVIAALHACEQVAQATVTVDHKQRRLIGYVVLDNELSALPETTQISRITAQLTAALPSHMIPALIIALPEMPLTVNGKIDKAALPAADATITTTAYRAPRHAVERQLCDIWQTVLHLPQVGIDDNFFQLGGNSLAAVRVGILCRQLLSVDLPLPLLFEHKTIARLQKHLVEGQQQITAQHLNEYPLSFAQERMWFIEQFETESTASAYHIPYLLKLSATADMARLLAAIETVLQRHAVTIGRFRIDSEGQVQQSVNNRHLCSAADADLRSLVTPEKGACAAESNVFAAIEEVSDAQQAARQLVAQAFDFDTQAGVKVFPMRDQHQQAFVFVLWHHLLFDGWSQQVFFNEISTVYAGQALPPLTLQYGDYALWQRELLQGESVDAQKAFWQQNLADFSPLNLPADYKRPAEFDYQGDMVELAIDNTLLAELQRFAQQQETTLYTLMLSGFFLLLKGFSGQSDIVIGTASDNRDEGGVGELIGLFVNSLAIRQQLSDVDSVSAFIQQVHQGVLAAKRHQQLPFEQVLDLLDIDRDLSRSPLFQVMFTMQDTVEMPAQLPLELVDFVQDDVAKFDLNLLIKPTDTGASAIFNFARSIYAKARVTQWAAAYVQVLQQLLRVESLSDVTVLTDDEREQLLHKWHRRVDFGGEQHLAARFLRTVQQQGDSTALITATQTLSFAELNARANQVAHSLIESGVTENNRFVGVCLPRSIDFLIAIIGIWKAGGAYVPLDPNSPLTRLAYIHENAKLTCVISNDEQAPLAQQITANTVTLQQMRNYPVDNVLLSSNADDVAYVIYTSGSTGKPKGVMIAHRSAINLAHSLRELGFGDNELAWGWMANVAFDGSVQGISQLILGQALSIISDDEKQDLDALPPRLAQIGIMDTTPALVDVWLDTPLAEHLPNMLIGGEAINDPLWQRLVAWQAQSGKAIYNEYGPTEITVLCTYQRVTGDIPAIGLSLPNTCAYVMNEQQQLLPFDSIGELVIGGAGVAKGYVDLPDMTAERFIDNPFYDDSDPCSSPRLYRSGDCVKRLPSGELVFCGRDDDQVKVRGYRIELDEVSAGIQGSDLAKQQVRDVMTILVKHGATGDATLVSFYIPKDGSIALDSAAAEQQAEQLLAAASAFLPDFMLPKRLIALAEFPVTPNGKVDKASLPIPDFSARQADYVAPETELQRQVSALFTQLLGVETPSIHDDFFALGGHSLIATKLSNLVTVQFNVPLRVKDIFLFPSVASIATRIETLQNDAAEPQVEQRVTKFHEDDAFDMDTFEL